MYFSKHFFSIRGFRLTAEFEFLGLDRSMFVISCSDLLPTFETFKTEKNLKKLQWQRFAQPILTNQAKENHLIVRSSKGRYFFRPLWSIDANEVLSFLL